MYKVIILSTDQTFLQWKTLQSKQQKILDALNSIKNGVFSLHFALQNVVPEVDSRQRITHRFMESISKQWFAEGYDFIALHISEEQKKIWGIQSSLRGMYWNDGNEIHEMYFWANEDTVRTHGLNQMEQTFCHEFSHAYHRGAGLVDITHEFHDKNPDITKLFPTFDMSLFDPARYRLRTRIVFLQKLLSSLQKLRGVKQTTDKLCHPIPFPYRTNITQPYGVPANRYPLTKHHIGVDYGCPVGTIIVAPFDGEVNKVGFTQTLGNYLHFTYTVNGKKYTERYAHLVSRPKNGVFKKASIIARSGNTGLSYGPHVHRDCWFNDINLTGINQSNFRSRTLDPETSFEYEY